MTERVMEWLKDYWIVVVVIAVFAVALPIACSQYGIKSDYDNGWLINPANPASPVHSLLFH